MSQIAIHQLIRGSFLAGVLFVTLNAHAVVTVSGAGIADQLSDDGASVSVDIKSAFNGNPNTFALTSGALPDGLSLNGITGLITGTVNPSASEASPYSAEISASDGGTPVPDAFTWTVTNIAPLAVADKNGINEAGTTITGNVLANDADGAPDTDILMVSAINGGTVGAATAGTYGSLVLNSDGSYTYTIDNLNPMVQALDAGQTLLDTLTYTANDKEGGTSNATLDITITGVNDLPVVTGNFTGSVTEGNLGDTVTVSGAINIT
ncbi:MAG: VCBS domain-containing protein, partial [SAR86 cluster bacterium]